MKVKENFVGTGQSDTRLSTIPVCKGDVCTLAVDKDGNLAKDVTWKVVKSNDIDPYTVLVDTDGREITISHVVRSRGKLGLKGNSNNEVINDFLKQYASRSTDEKPASIKCVDTKTRGERVYSFFDWV